MFWFSWPFKAVSGLFCLLGFYVLGFVYLGLVTCGGCYGLYLGLLFWGLLYIVGFVFYYGQLVYFGRFSLYFSSFGCCIVIALFCGMMRVMYL